MKQFVVYCIIGIFNTIIHGVTFYISFSILDIQSISNLMGFIVAVSFSYLANATFNFKKEASVSSFLKMTFSLGLLAFLLGIMSDYCTISPIFTFLGTVVLSTVIGFILTKFYVFKEK